MSRPRTMPPSVVTRPATPQAANPTATLPGAGGESRRDGGVIAVLVALLGFTLVVQFRSNADAELATARQEDLVRILSDLEARRTGCSRRSALWRTASGS